MRRINRLCALLLALALTLTLLPAVPAANAEANPFNRQDNREVPYTAYPGADGGVRESEIERTSVKPRLAVEKVALELSEAEANREVSVRLTLSGNTNGEWACSGFSILFDGRLTIKTTDSGRPALQVGVGAEKLSREARLDNEYGGRNGGIFVATSAADDYGRDGVLYSLTFTLPDDAAEGDLYPIGIIYTKDQNRNSLFSDCYQSNPEMQAYLFTRGITNGYIKINGGSSGGDDGGGSGSCSHSWSVWHVEREAGCTAAGERSRGCSLCYTVQREAIPALGHAWGQWSGGEPTCTERGIQARMCSRCHATENQYTPALGHSWSEWRMQSGKECDDPYAVTRGCPRCYRVEYRAVPGGHSWSEWIVVKAPTAAEPGLRSRGCAVCGTVEKEQFTAVENLFADVPEGKFYTDAVRWAVSHVPPITKGTDATHFSPTTPCTRGQVVTFLWRANGNPAPKSTTHPFTDVKAGAYYYDAMLWAVENKVTQGTDATHFSPDGICTRGQVVTFLWRAKGCPRPKNTTHPFTDVKAGAYYYDAMLWAVENKVTQGTDATHFNPNGDCTRGQVVTFLFRADKAPNAPNQLGGEFLLYVEDALSISGRGPMITGTVVNGTVSVGEKLKLLTWDESTMQKKEYTLTVAGIEKKRESLNSASAGDSVGILFTRDVDKSVMLRGSALVKPDSKLTASTGPFYGTLHMLTGEEGGRRTPIFADYKPQWYYADGTDVTATVLELGGEEMALPGQTLENVKAGDMAKPVVWYVGQEIALKEGGKTVGYFTVSYVDG